MNELARHIESLLVTNDCVIVPGLGGFVTRHVSAHRIEEENLFLPPYRSVGFNAQLTMNDGLLAQSFMQSHDSTYPETIRFIEDLVMDIKRQLRENGIYELDGIGKLSLNLDGSYDFVPCEAGVLSPEHYGLGSFTIEELAADEEQSLATTFRKNKFRFFWKPSAGQKKEYVVRINRNRANYAIATVAAAMFYLFFSMPMGSSSGPEITMASVSNGMVWGLPTLSDIRGAQPIVLQESKHETAKVQPQIKPEKAPSVATHQKPSECYTIVLASAISEKNAQSMTEKLKQDSIGEPFVYKKGNMVRVACGRFDSKEDAYKQMNEFRSRALFPDAWVLSINQ